MRKKNIQTKIVRIPLSPSSKPVDIKPRFQPMPILYLELLENKKKVIHNLINTEYKPENYENDKRNNKEDSEEDIKSRDRKYEKREERDKDEDRDKYKRDRCEERDEEDEVRDKYKRDRREERDEENEDREEYRDKSRDKYKRDRREERDDEDEDRYEHRDKSRDKYRRDERDDEYSRSRDSERSNDKEGRNKFSRDSRDDYKSVGDSRGDKHEDKYRRSSRDSIASSRRSDLSTRLRNILKDDTESERSYRDRDRDRDRERDRERGDKSRSEKPVKIPPPLSELEARGQININKEMKDINYINMSDDEDAKREILLKFEILKKSYANSTVPEFTIHSDLNTMKKSYETTLKRLSLDSSVDGYKQFLIAGFLGAEFVIGNWLNFDMKGFTRQQIIQMNKYERLLIELGEKSYVPQESKWPVEMRLLSMIIMNAAFFVLTKMVANKSGANLLDMFNSMSSGITNTVQENSTNSNKPVKKNRMKGPEIDIEDLPDVST